MKYKKIPGTFSYEEFSHLWKLLPPRVIVEQTYNKENLGVTDIVVYLPDEACTEYKFALKKQAADTAALLITIQNKMSDLYDYKDLK